MKRTLLVPEMIKQKRNGETLSRDQIRYIVGGYTDGTIPDYQMAAWLMAVYFQGMTVEESSALTECMLNSGRVIAFPNLTRSTVDKHSTGGVGDKTSLILAPIVAAAGLHVPMISGRGLGHTGGTLDKLESIPGFNTQISVEKFQDLVSTVGLSFLGQTPEICPADRKIYSLRDVTATIESLPLICASIMSKKLAEGIQGLVLDVKFGSGAFMRSPEAAEQLARALMEIGHRHGKKVCTLLTDMNQPLGRTVGNAIEVEECLSVLKGENLADYSDTLSLSLELSARMLWLGGLCRGIGEARRLAREKIESGEAYRKFEEIVRLQGGDLGSLPQLENGIEVKASQRGFISTFDCEGIGYSSILTGAGRRISSDPIDPLAGIRVHRKIGEKVEVGDPVFTVYSSDSQKSEAAVERLKTCYAVGTGAPATTDLVFKTLCFVGDQIVEESVSPEG